MTIFGQVPWRAFPKLTALLPQLEELAIYGDKYDAVYHPTYPRLTCGAFSASSVGLSLTKLVLAQLQFHSLADIFQVLAAFPRMSEVMVANCFVQSKVVPVPRSSATHLRKLQIACTTDQDGITKVADFAPWWQWPHAMNSAVGPFPGLHPVDAQTIGAIMTSFGIGMIAE